VGTLADACFRLWWRHASNRRQEWNWGEGGRCLTTVATCFDVPNERPVTTRGREGGGGPLSQMSATDCHRTRPSCVSSASADRAARATYLKSRNEARALVVVSSKLSPAVSRGRGLPDRGPRSDGADRRHRPSCWDTTCRPSHTNRDTARADNTAADRFKFLKGKPNRTESDHGVCFPGSLNYGDLFCHEPPGRCTDFFLLRRKFRPNCALQQNAKRP
jgi:hypothetical protein